MAVTGPRIRQNAAGLSGKPEKLMHVLVVATEKELEPGVAPTAEEVIDGLPSVEEMKTAHLGLCKTASGPAMGIFYLALIVLR